MQIKEKGFTLIEVVAALLILSMAILLFSNFFVRGYSLSKNQDNQMIAMNLARQVAEEWKSGNGRVSADGSTVSGRYSVTTSQVFTYDELKGFKNETIPLNTNNPIVINGRNYVEEVNVTDLSPDNPDLVLLLTITVRDARTHAIAATLHTSIAPAEEG